MHFAPSLALSYVLFHQHFIASLRSSSVRCLSWRIGFVFVRCARARATIFSVFHAHSVYKQNNKQQRLWKIGPVRPNTQLKMKRDKQNLNKMASHLKACAQTMNAFCCLLSLCITYMVLIIGNWQYFQ